MEVKNNKKGFRKYIGQKRQAKDSIPPLINEKGKLASTDMGKAEVLNMYISKLWGILKFVEEQLLLFPFEC